MERTMLNVGVHQDPGGRGEDGRCGSGLMLVDSRCTPSGLALQTHRPVGHPISETVGGLA